MNFEIEQHPAYPRLQEKWLYMDVYMLMEHMYPDWPYHNINHAAKTFERAMQFVDDFHAHGIHVDEEAVATATLVHDSLFHLPLEGTPFKTKEERSAFVYEHIMPGFGFTEERVQLGKGCILATHKEGECETNESLITVRADMGNVYDTSLIFLSDFRNVSLEVMRNIPKKQLRDLIAQHKLLPTLLDGSSDVIGQYIFKRDLRFPWERDEPDECRFTSDTRTNLAYLRQIGEQVIAGLVADFGDWQDKPNKFQARR